MKFRVGVALVGGLALSGCVLEGDYEPPAVAVPTHFVDAQRGGRETDPQWWREFHDPLLDGFEANVETANPNLAAALANSQIAAAHAQVALAGAYPEIDAGSSITTNKQSANRPLRSPNQPTYFGNNQLYGQIASYEIDIWGRVADIVKAANADAQAAADDYGTALLETRAELARDYIDLRGLDAEGALLQRTIVIYRSALDLTHSRVVANISPPMDEERAKTQLDSAQATASDLALRRASLVSAIATLTGTPAPEFTISPSSKQIAFPVRPKTVPGDVLLRRPDVAAAERENAAASATVGVAIANFYPKFTIGLFGGTQDTGFALFAGKNTDYTIGPAVSMPIFDFGLRQAELKEARAHYLVTSANYRAAVLRAYQEVQQSLTDLRWLANEAEQTRLAADAAEKTSDMSMALYRDGAASYLDVVSAQSAALELERQLIALRSLQLRANVALMMALGGGWTTETGAKQLAEIVNP